MPQPILTVDLSPELRVTQALQQFASEPLVLLFDSAAPVRRTDARWSILTADPVETEELATAAYGSKPFRRLREWQQRLPLAHIEAPFCGGIAGLMSYEIAGAFEVLPCPGHDDFQTPALLAGLYDWAIVWDHVLRTVQLHVIPNLCRSTSEERVAWVMQHVDAPTQDNSKRQPVSQQESASQDALKGFALPSHEGVTSCFSRNEYLDAVRKVIDYIHAGDIFQANLAQQLTAAWQGSAADLYERVRRHNPAPFSSFLQHDSFAVVSASPERFLQVREGRYVETRPIKGTRRRQRSPIADLYTSSELRASEKDRAENVMIVDLLRNDLSRVCAPGTVKVTGLCEIEVFETVQHLVSTVIGEIRSDCDIWDLCAAAVPGGSITGAPKIRAMEIIAELEPVVRGAYCGNLFFAGPNGSFDSSILIRTFTLKNGRVQFPVGGGIVADSRPEDEYAETLHKAAGMLTSLQSSPELPSR